MLDRQRTPRVLLGIWGNRVSPSDNLIIVDFGAHAISRGGHIAFGRRCSSFMVASMLVSAIHGGVVTKADLFAALYGDREDGGPFDKTIDVFLMQARRALHPLAITIDTKWGIGLTSTAHRRLDDQVAA